MKQRKKFHGFLHRGKPQVLSFKDMEISGPVFRTLGFFFFWIEPVFAHYWVYFEMFSSNVAEMRTKHKDAFFKKHGVKLGFMSAFIKASAHALQSEPTVNAGQRSFPFQECL